jgi:hypothetical protein
LVISIAPPPMSPPQTGVRRVRSAASGRVSVAS